MQNYFFENNIHHFNINGGDARTMKMQLVVLLVVLVLGLGGYQYFTAATNIPAGFSIGGTLLLLIFFSRLLLKGKASRYQIQIDLHKQSIIAWDQKRKEEMWEDDFHSEYLYISEIQVVMGSQIYRYPALVYGENQKEIVEDGVPYPEQVVLGFAERGSLQRIQEVLIQPSLS